MAITVRRKTGLIGMLGALKLKINGQVVGKVAHDNRVHLDFPQGEAVLHISQGGSRSNKVHVRDGDTLVIRTSRRTKRLIFLMFAIPTLLRFFPDTIFNRPYIGLAAVAVIGAFLLVTETYEIRNVS